MPEIMTKMQAASLYLCVIKGFFRRVRHDLARELTVAVASSVVLATFAYVFDDFLNAEVAKISPSMRDAFAAALVPVVLALATATAASWGRRAVKSELAYGAWAKRVGTEGGSTRGLDVAVVITIVGCVHGTAWWIVLERLATPPAPWLVGGALAAASLAFALAPAKSRRSVGEAGLAPLITVDDRSGSPTQDATKVRALATWRLGLLARRLVPARFAFAACVVLLLPAFFSAYRGLPVFVAGASALAAGIAAAAALAFQLAEDLRHPWQERGAGVSHDQFVAAWERVAYVVAGVVAVVAAAACLAGAALAPALTPVSAGGAAALAPWPLVDGTLKVALLTALPVLCAPWLMLQIDGRRPAVVMVPLALVTAFVGTTVLASWLGLLLLPLLRYYAVRSQAGRFYRA
jgi:hypothetical protein